MGAQACPAWTAEQKTACNKTCVGAAADLAPECNDELNAATACVRAGATWDCTLGYAASCMAQATKLEACQRANGTATVTAGLAPYCKKCSDCLTEDAAFDEGFCKPFWDSASSTFDEAKCVAEGDPWDIMDRTLSEVELTAMTCEAFDNAT